MDDVNYFHSIWKKIEHSTLHDTLGVNNVKKNALLCLFPRKIFFLMKNPFCKKSKIEIRFQNVLLCLVVTLKMMQPMIVAMVVHRDGSGNEGGNSSIGGGGGGSNDCNGVAWYIAVVRKWLRQ